MGKSAKRKAQKRRQEQKETKPTVCTEEQYAKNCNTLIDMLRTGRENALAKKTKFLEYQRRYQAALARCIRSRLGRSIEPEIPQDDVWSPRIAFCDRVEQQFRLGIELMLTGRTDEAFKIARDFHKQSEKEDEEISKAQKRMMQLINYEMNGISIVASTVKAKDCEAHITMRNRNVDHVRPA